MVKLQDIKHAKTEANVAKYGIDLNGYDSVAEVRKAIKRAQNRERKRAKINNPSEGISVREDVTRESVRESVREKPPLIRQNASAASSDRVSAFNAPIGVPKWASELTQKTKENVVRYKLNVLDYPTKQDLTKAIQRIKMKEHREKKKSKLVGSSSIKYNGLELSDEDHLDFNRRYGQPLPDDSEDE